MNTVNYINVSLEVFGALLSLIIIFFSLIAERKKTPQDKLFTRLLSWNAIVQISDAFAWTFNGRPDVLHGSIVYIANFLCYVSGYILMAVFGEYFVSFLVVTDKKTARYFSRAIWGVALVATVLVVISQFNGMYYMVDAQNVYHRQSMFWLSQVFGIAGVAICVVMMIKCRNCLGKNERFLLVSFIIMIPAALVAQIFTYGITFLYIATTFSGICIYIFIQAEQSRKHSENELELERTRTAVMLSQINPHFMYNTLTAIRFLCDTDPQMASKIVTEFALFLRGNVDSLNATTLIPFEREFEHLNHYLNIEKLRFSDTLTVETEIQTTNFMLPPLTLQPIVENAIKHGIGKKEGGGTVKIRTRQTAHETIITVADDGAGFDPSVKKSDGNSHIGIENVCTRLSMQCGGKLKIESVLGAGTTATIMIPKREG